MALQNRVTPFGDIIETKARGSWMGNRGQLHSDEQNILRSYKLKAWLICLLQFKGRHRTVMAPNRYTELFFLDEATAFAAGHRPCFECRREDYNRFKDLYIKANPFYGLSDAASIKAIDDILHTERMNPDGSKKTYKADIHTLPDGTFISVDGKAYLVADQHLYPWSAEGYQTKVPLPHIAEADVLTPLSIVNTFRAGYTPQMNKAISIV